jgi:hypothetical protein
MAQAMPTRPQIDWANAWLLAAIGLVGIGINPLHAAPGDAGTVLAQAGQCFVEARGTRAPLKAGDTVHVGDMLEASAGGRLKLRLDDGSVISIASGSRMKITAYSAAQTTGRDVKLSLGAGLLRAVVTVFSQPSHFEVDTATGVAAVRSTDWFIEAKTDSTQVGVLEGRVSLTSTATGRSVEVPARWGARVEQGRDPVPGRVWTTAEFNDAITRTDVNPGR